MTNIYFDDVEQFYPYRTALPAGNVIARFTLFASEDYAALRKMITLRGHTLDNHTAWRTPQACFFYSDNKLTICTDLLIQNW